MDTKAPAQVLFFSSNMMFAVALLAVDENRPSVSGAHFSFTIGVSMGVSMGVGACVLVCVFTCAAFLTFVFQLVCSFGSLVLQVLHHVIDFGLVFQEKWSNDAVVNHYGSIRGSGGHAPHQEGTLGERRQL